MKWDIFSPSVDAAVNLTLLATLAPAFFVRHFCGQTDPPSSADAHCELHSDFHPCMVVNSNSSLTMLYFIPLLCHLFYPVLSVLYHLCLCQKALLGSVCQSNLTWLFVWLSACTCVVIIMCHQDEEEGLIKDSNLLVESIFPFWIPFFLFIPSSQEWICCSLHPSFGF